MNVQGAEIVKVDDPRACSYLRECFRPSKDSAQESPGRVEWVETDFWEHL